MASLSISADGLKRVRFKSVDGQRVSIRLGRLPKKDAETVRSYVSRLETAQQVGSAIDADTLKWLSRINDWLRDKLIHAGLIDKPDGRAAVTLDEHIANYFAKRTDVKPNTLVHWRHARRSLLAYFGPNRPLVDITAGDARDWERWMKTGEARENRYNDREADEGLAPNTVRKRVSDAKQFFQDAVERDLLMKNPFAGLNGTVGSNRDRDYFVTRDESQKVIDVCPDAQWRLLFALARYGGLRCPSEHLALTWADVNLPDGRMLVRSPKTEGYEGKGSRLVPIFPELRPYLEAVWEEAEPGTQYVITRYREANANLRTQLQRIIRRAGLVGWPKLWQNLRATRATELANEYPAHVAAAWLGHSTVVASKHYWQVTDADFERASSRASYVAPNRAHAASIQAGNASLKTVGAPVFSEENEVLLNYTSIQVGGTGLEPAQFSPGKSHIPNQGGPKSGPLDSPDAPATPDPALAMLVNAWPALSLADRKAILGIVRRAAEVGPAKPPATSPR